MQNNYQKWLALIALLTIFILSACSTPPVADSKLAQRLAQTPSQLMLEQDDGPYVLYQEDSSHLDIYWQCQNEVIHLQQPAQLPIPVKCGYQKEITIDGFAAVNPQSRFQAPKIAVISDLHGQFGLLTELLQNNKVITPSWEWNFANGHLVIVGDVFDRGPQQTEALWLIYQLEQQAKQQGGQVHLLLGNHETMIFYNDLRYLNKKYSGFAEKLGVEFPSLYDKNTVLGAWLHSKPVIITINDILFVHGGIHPEFQTLGLSLTEVNNIFRSSLGVERNTLRQDPLLNFLYGSKGPLWYRGYFRDSHPLTSNQLDALLSALKLDYIVLGHTSFSGIYQHWNGRVYNVDSNIKRGEHGEVLFWEAGKFTRGTQFGELGAVPIYTKNED